MTNETNVATPVIGSEYVPEFGYGGFWKRFFAYVLDCFIVGLLYSSINYTISVSGTTTVTTTSKIISFAISFAYFLFFWVYQNGSTLGKKIMGLRIIREDGQPLDIPTAIVRYIGYFISGAILFIGFISIGFSSKKQGWHDKMANTLVIKTDNKSHAGWAILISILFSLFFVFILIAIVVGYTSVRNLKSKSASLPPEFTKLMPTLSPEDSQKLDEKVAILVDQNRLEKKLKPIIVDSKLCAYAQRRLTQLKEFGRYDDAKGFYEDSGKPEIQRAYFTGYSTVGENIYALQSFSTSTDVINNWLAANPSNVIDPQKTSGCIRSDSNFIVYVSASSFKK